MADQGEEVVEVEESEAPEAVTANEEEETEVSWEQAMEWKKKAERLDKAEKALVEKKRQEKANKNKEAETTEPKGFITKDDLAFERFLDKNPELEEFREDLEKYVKKGNTLSEAKLLVENSPVATNRKKIERIWVSYSEGSPAQTTYTRSEMEAMSQKDYNAIMRKVEDWKVSIR